jgi:hypothetical protein
MQGASIRKKKKIGSKLHVSIQNIVRHLAFQTLAASHRWCVSKFSAQMKQAQKEV